MQTFLPYESFAKTAVVLDYRRLGKQRVEAKQIIQTIELGDKANGWKNHPAVNMWRGYIPALALYGMYICVEWLNRGYNDSQLAFFEQYVEDNIVYPYWLGDRDFHLSHQASLLRKDRDHYDQFFDRNVLRYEDYIWPKQASLV